MFQKNLLLLINIIFLIIFIPSCKKTSHVVEIKLLILTPDNYYGIASRLTGKIYEVGPGGMWFILEDKTGYIQVTTENIPTHISCIQLHKQVTILGKLNNFEGQKYFSFLSLLGCSN